MSKTNQLKRGSELVVGGLGTGLLLGNMALGSAGDLHAWLRKNSATYRMSSDASLKKNALDADFAILIRKYLVAKFKEVIINNLKVSELTPDQLIRFTELEAEVDPAYTNDDVRTTIALVALDEEISASKP